MANKKHTKEYFINSEKMRFEITLTTNLYQGIQALAAEAGQSPKKYIEFMVLNNAVKGFAKMAKGGNKS